MGSIRDLVRDLRGEERTINPLEQIGFSPAILRLGLSEDQLYDYCRRSARTLLAQVHPDRVGKESEEAIKFSAALNSLNDRGAFRQAMIEFREARSYERAEERTLHQQIRVLAKQNADLQAAYEDVRADAEKEKGFHIWMRRYFAGHTLHITQEPVMPVAECRRLTVLSFKFEFASGSRVQAKLKEAHAFYAEAARRTSTTRLLTNDEAHLNGLASRHNLGAIQIADLIDRMSKSIYALPAIHWDYDLAVREIGMSKITGLTEASRRGVIRQSDISENALHDGYRNCLSVLRKRFGGEYVLKADMFAEVIPMRGQLSEAPTGMSEGKYIYVLGTTELLTARLIDPIPKQWARLGVHEKEFLHEWRRREAGGGPGDLLGCEPIIAPGRAIVSTDVDAVRPLRPSGADHQIAGFKKRREEVLQRKKLQFFIAHLVLNAE